MNIIVADDESLTRKSTIRVLQNASRRINCKINIIESSDGLDTVFLIYKATNLGIRISLILSDENMNFMNGIKSSSILYEIYQMKNIKKIPFHILTANCSSYDRLFLVNKGIETLMSKPLSIKMAENVLLKLAS